MQGQNSAGRLTRSYRANVKTGAHVTPADLPMGKKVFPPPSTVGKYIEEDQAMAERLKGGKRVEQPLSIRQGSPSLTP